MKSVRYGGLAGPAASLMCTRAALSAVLALQCLAWSATVSAQPAPSTESMVDQLRPRNTRSLRNLVVEPREDIQGQTRPAVKPARPSLALSIEFDFNSARVRPEGRKLLQNLAQAMQSPELATSRFAIEGHTDVRGGAEYNQRLSQRRADTVRDLLALQGVQPQRLSPLGKGAAEPANPNDPSAPENRRVLIVTLD